MADCVRGPTIPSGLKRWSTDLRLTRRLLRLSCSGWVVAMIVEGATRSSLGALLEAIARSPPTTRPRSANAVRLKTSDFAPVSSSALSLPIAHPSHEPRPMDSALARSLRAPRAETTARSRRCSPERTTWAPFTPPPVTALPTPSTARPPGWKSLLDRSRRRRRRRVERITASHGSSRPVCHPATYRPPSAEAGSLRHSG